MSAVPPGRVLVVVVAVDPTPGAFGFMRVVICGLALLVVLVALVGDPVCTVEVVTTVGLPGMVVVANIVEVEVKMVEVADSG